MLDRPLLLQMKLPFIDTIHPQSNKVVMGVKIKTIGESKLTDRSVMDQNIIGLRVMAYETPVTIPCV